jgi:hypothetical protein
MNASHAPSSVAGEGRGDRGHDWYDNHTIQC